MKGAEEDARRVLAQASRVVFLTGAGMSAESGVPTFRGAEGLWRSHRAEELATPEAFRRDPRLVWEWYAWRRGLVSACEPNAGHLAVARFAAAPGREVTVVTQNVDGLHEVAACRTVAASDARPALPLELHGALFRNRCSGCGARSDGRGAVDASAVSTLPRCALCGSLLRPDVVWFGESLDRHVLERAVEAARDADVCVVVGTSGLVSPAASIPLETVHAGGLLVEVNPEETPLSRWARHALRGGAARLLSALLEEGSWG